MPDRLVLLAEEKHLCRALICVCPSLRLTYVDDQGGTHVLGFVNMKIEPPITAGQTVAESVQIQSVGVSIYSTPINRGVALGYARPSGEQP
jgi:hypothetical protein